MQLAFNKYQGTGNDFIMVDNRQHIFPKNDTNLVAQLCDRRFGIGADGLILLEQDPSADFKMVYYNADGNESTMCGNGGRCIVAFARDLKLIESETKFNAIDGLHWAKIEKDTVTLQMINVTEIKDSSTHLFLDTGSPHHVQLVENVDAVDVFSEGRRLRYEVYGEEGSNINFVHTNGSDFIMRTYERGVEDETLSCGTGVTAVALAMHHLKKATTAHIPIQTKGGDLQVTFDFVDGEYQKVMLIGKAKYVFKGKIEC